jgi:hypothetical protein
MPKYIEKNYWYKDSDQEKTHYFEYEEITDTGIKTAELTVWEDKLL